MARQIVLDTETTGISPKNGHRIIEIGCIELINREFTGSVYHQYINPQREIDPGAQKVHGITNEFLADKPRFADIATDFFNYIKGSELIIHNAPFDVGFIDHEFKLLRKKLGNVASICDVLDTLVLARKKHPGQRNNLDALCKRYEVDNTNREYHGALLDSELLAKVYLMMTGGQTSLFAEEEETASNYVLGQNLGAKSMVKKYRLKVARACKNELTSHLGQLELIDKESNGNCIWEGSYYHGKNDS